MGPRINKSNATNCLNLKDQAYSNKLQILKFSDTTVYVGEELVNGEMSDIIDYFY